jgi:hypothetical protein
METFNRRRWGGLEEIFSQTTTCWMEILGLRGNRENYDNVRGKIFAKYLKMLSLYLQKCKIYHHFNGKENFALFSQRFL